jgi:hypothetical protein
MPITAQGMGQPDLDTFLRAVATLSNELRTDRATMLTGATALWAKLDADSGVTDADYEALFEPGAEAYSWPADPAAAALVVSGFTSIDMSQEDMTDYLATVETLLNELKTDRTTLGTAWDALMAKLDADGLTDTDYAAVLGVGGTGDAWPAVPSAAAVSDSAISAQGVSQPDLVTLLTAIQTLANELRTDRTAIGAAYDALMAKLDADATVGDTNYAAVLGIGGSGAAWPANPAASALNLSA